MAELGNTPEFPEPVTARVDELNVLKDGSLRVWFVLEDGALFCVEIPTESEGMARVLEALGGATTEVLSAIGQRGLDVIGFNEDEDEADQEGESE